MAKIIKYKILSTELNAGTVEDPIIKQIFVDKETICPNEDILNANLPVVLSEAYNGEYTIEDDGQPDQSEIPTELEALDARLTYVEMMTGLMEV